jgi:hypothetical protein
MTLNEFLLGAGVVGLSDQDALIAAQAARVGQLISPDMMLSFLTNFNHIDILDIITENPNTPVTKEAKGLRKAFSFGSEFNLITGHPASVLPMLIQLKDDVIVGQPFVDYCIYYANDLSPKRWPTITLHDIKVVRGTCPAVAVTAVDGYVVIETNAGCEKHNPRLVATIVSPRTLNAQTKLVNTFIDVAIAGNYEVKVPAEYNGQTLFVEDAYGVISGV